MTATNHSNVPDRVKTPELESEEEQPWTQFLLQQSPRRRQRRNANANPPIPAPIPTAEEVQARMRQQARMVDQILNDSDTKENYENIVSRKGEFSRLNFQPNIKPLDELWRDQFLFFQKELNSKSINDVLDENFLDWQKSLLLPPIVNGAILNLQGSKTEEYRRALREDFKGPGLFDNMITKLTMLHFGLPVEPFTLNNVLNAGQNENDAADAPEPPPRMQRILYAETPLEFLDGYDKRSYGFPMIRMKSQLHLRGAGADEEDLRNADLNDSDGGVRMRGGAGVEFYLYGKDARIQLRYNDDAETFIKAAFKLLDADGIWDKNGKWNFVVDQYDNSNQSNGQAEKELVGEPFEVNHENYKYLWENTLQKRVFNQNGDWVMVVRLSRNGGGAPATYKLQAALKETSAAKTKEPPGLTRPQISPLYSQPKTTTPPGDIGFVYGYAGKIQIKRGQKAFMDAAFDLLHLPNREDWTFEFDVVNPRGRFFAPVTVSKTNFASRYKLFIEKRLAGSEWPVFVRSRFDPPPTTLEPELTMMSIIKLTLNGRGTAYWKLPANPSEPYGINQLQDDFFRAMQVLFPERLPRPASNVYVDNCLLGFGGMELTDELLSNTSIVSGDTIAEFKVQLNTTASFDEPLGIRIMCAKNGESAAFNKASDNFEKIYGSLSDMALKIMNSNKLPAKFRVWETATYRESNTESAVIPFTPAAIFVEELNNFLGSDFQNIGTSCLCFRPEFENRDGGILTAVDRELPGVFWNIGSQNTLAQFRGLVKKLFRDQREHAADFFEMVSLEFNLRFVIDMNTTEDQWRKHVYDYLPTTKFQISRESPFTYAVDTSTPWGLPPQSKTYSPNSEPMNLGSKLVEPNNTGSESLPPPQITVRPTPTNSAGSSAGLSPGRNRGGGGASGSQPAPSSSRALVPLGIPITRGQAVARFNRDRYLKPRVSQSKPVKWDTHMTHQNRQTDLKHKSFAYDLSVIEPGQKPEIPIFGAFKELVLSQGPSFPEIFCHAVTPTDLRALKEENRALRNMVLDRRHKCDWCEFTFPNLDADAKRAHFTEHAKQLAEGGESCPVCGSTDWLWMTMPQRREHLFADQDRRERDTIKTFWKAMTCPICDKDLSHIKAELVLRHVASHNPDVLKFCDRCGRNQETLTVTEGLWHTRMCVESKEAFHVRNFCDRCGLDVSNKTPRKLLKHINNCQSIPPRIFCTKCALDLSKIRPHEAHVHQDNCREPAGPPKSFCTRCGINRLQIDETGKAAHEQSCFMIDPRPRIDAENILELERKCAELRQLRASIRKEQVQLYQDQSDRKRFWRANPRKCPHCVNHTFPVEITVEELIEHFEKQHVPAVHAASRTSQTPSMLRHLVPPALGTDNISTDNGFQNTSPQNAPQPGADQTQLEPVFDKNVANQHTQETNTEKTSESRTTLSCPFGNLQKCHFTIKLPLQTVDAFLDHWKRAHESLRGTLSCPFKSLTHTGEACSLPFTYTVRPFESEQFVNHVKEKHSSSPQTVKCPFGGPSLGCKEVYNITDNANAFMNHLTNEHVDKGNNASNAGADFPTICRIKSSIGVICVQNLNSVQEVFDHFMDQHPLTVLTTPPPLPTASKIKRFTCPLETPSKERCSLPVDIPGTGNIEAIKRFISHYQHTPHYGGPNDESINLVLQESLDTAVHQLRDHEEFLSCLILVNDRNALESANKTREEITEVEKVIEDLKRRLGVFDHDSLLTDPVSRERQPTTPPLTPENEPPVTVPALGSSKSKTTANVATRGNEGKKTATFESAFALSSAASIGKRSATGLVSDIPIITAKTTKKKRVADPVRKDHIAKTLSRPSQASYKSSSKRTNVLVQPVDESRYGDTVVDATGFEPSPIDQYFPRNERSTKRRAAFNLPDATERLPSETAQVYSNRLKRQKVAAANHVDMVGENEDESYRPRLNARLRAGASSSQASATLPAIAEGKKEVKSVPSKVAKNTKRGRKEEKQEGVLMSPVHGSFDEERTSAVELVTVAAETRRSTRRSTPRSAVPALATVGRVVGKQRMDAQAKVGVDMVEVEEEEEDSASKKIRGSREVERK